MQITVDLNEMSPRAMVDLANALGHNSNDVDDPQVSRLYEIMWKAVYIELLNNGAHTETQLRDLVVCPEG